jgi:hypothetical protein
MSENFETSESVQETARKSALPEKLSFSALQPAIISGLIGGGRDDSEARQRAEREAELRFYQQQADHKEQGGR